MNIMRSSSGDSVGINLNQVSFRVLLNVLRGLPGLEIQKKSQNPITDDSSATFTYKGFSFQVYTPVSDYWIDQPENCPSTIFSEIVMVLEKFRVRWWHRIL
jgi:hypothetical protein